MFFTSPVTIDEDGIDLQFSYQAGYFPLEGQSNSAHGRVETTSLEGHARLRVGQWYMRAIDNLSSPAGTDSAALFIQIARVDYPAEPAEEPVAVLSAAHPSVE